MLEKKLKELALESAGEDFVEKHFNMANKTTKRNPEQDAIDTDLFESDYFCLDDELIRVRMKECKLALKQLHEQVGVSYRTVIRWLSDSEFP